MLKQLLSSVIGDGFVLANLAGGNFAGFSVSQEVSGLLTSRAATAREILIQEVRRGERPVTDSQIEEGVAVVYRYFRAALEGSARLNLRLMANVIAGRARLGTLAADEFLAEADILASLRCNEIVLLGTMYRARHDGLEDPLTWAKKQLVLFADEMELRATAAAVIRNGLIEPVPLWGSNGYALTPLLDQLLTLADIEATLLSR